jgi:HlyD family secretion protein
MRYPDNVFRLQITGPLVLALVFVFCAGCSKEPAEKEATVSVEIVPVEKKSIEHIVTADAILFPLTQSAITPKISAPVKAFYVKRGSQVRQGQLLATLENRDLAAAAQDSKGAYDQARATYQTTTAATLPEELQKAELDANASKASLDAQEKIYKSRQELFSQGALPRKELDQGLVDYTNARNQYELAQKHLDALKKFGNQQGMLGAAGQLESAKGKNLAAEAQLSYSEIRSPINGVVTDRPLYPGEMAAAGTPLLTVMDMSAVIARAHIPQNDAALLKAGDAASVAVPGKDKPVEGKVTVVSPALDPNSTTVEVWVEIANPGAQLKPGTSVQISMVAKTIKDAIVIPKNALLNAADGTTSVMLAGTDSRAHQKPVVVGISEGDDIQVVSGLNEGDKVVGTGSFGLPDNTKIQPAATAKEEPDADKNAK